MEAVRPLILSRKRALGIQTGRYANRQVASAISLIIALTAVVQLIATVERVAVLLHMFVAETTFIRERSSVMDVLVRPLRIPG